MLIFLAALIHSASPSTDFLGMVSDRGLLAWFASYAKETPSFQQFLSNPLHSLSLPSINIYDSVVAATSTSTVLDAMKLMSDEGVSSIAVIDDETGTLLSAVSVTDIGKVCIVSNTDYLISSQCRLWFHQRATTSCRHPCTNSYLTLRCVSLPTRLLALNGCAGSRRLDRRCRQIPRYVDRYLLHRVSSDHFFSVFRIPNKCSLVHGAEATSQ